MAEEKVMTGLRQEKSARLKYLLGTNLGKLLRKNSFEEIKVTDLCRKVLISKVTFFKYFSCKEELLRYYFRVWCLGIGVELAKSPRSGIEGIYFIFEKVFESLKEEPSFLIQLLSYQMRDDRIRAPFPITNYERLLYYPEYNELENVEIKSLEQHLDTFVLEATLENNIKHRDTAHVTFQLHNYMLGSIVKSGLKKKSPNKVQVRQGIDSFLQSFR